MGFHSIINYMLENLADYYFYHVGDDVINVCSFKLPITENKLKDLITKKVSGLEKDVERFVVDNFYDEIKERLRKNETFYKRVKRQLKRC